MSRLLAMSSLLEIKPELEQIEVDGFRYEASSEGSTPRGWRRSNRNVAQEQAQD
jgi:hypothetical protein